MDKNSPKQKAVSSVIKDSSFHASFKDAIKNSTKGKAQYSDGRVDESLRDAFRRAVHQDKNIPKILYKKPNG